MKITAEQITPTWEYFRGMKASHGVCVIPNKVSSNRTSRNQAGPGGLAQRAFGAVALLVMSRRAG